MDSCCKMTQIMILASSFTHTMAQNSSVDYKDDENYSSLDNEEDMDGDPHLASAIFAGSIALLLWPLVDSFRNKLERKFWEPLEESPGCGNGNLLDPSQLDTFYEGLSPDACLNSCQWKENLVGWSVQANMANISSYQLTSTSTSTQTIQFWNLFSENLVDYTQLTDLYAREVYDIELEISISPQRIPDDISCVDECIRIYEKDLKNRFWHFKNCFDSRIAEAVPLRAFACYISIHSLYREKNPTPVTTTPVPVTTTTTTPETTTPVILNDKRTWSAKKRQAVNDSPMIASYTFAPETEEEEVFSYCIIDLLQNSGSIVPARQQDSTDDFDKLLEVLSEAKPPSTSSLLCSKLLGLTYSPTIQKEYLNDQQEERRPGRPPVKLFRSPWLCDLRTPGFRGRHRCGVTLLSGLEQVHDPILVSAAHCNSVCRDADTQQPIEICCCLQTSDAGSCQETSSFCPPSTVMDIAKPEEIIIVCDKNSLERVPEVNTEELEVVLKVKKVVNHPKYKRGKPIDGYDIAVYHVEPNEILKVQMRRKVILPACFPTNTKAARTKSVSSTTITKKTSTATTPSPEDEPVILLKGFKDPTPTYKLKNNLNYTLNDYVNDNLLPVLLDFDKIKCEDPRWMGSDTFYPQATVCYKTIRENCVVFGNSGSPMVEEFLTEEGEKRFCWIGPLSLSKGCDQTEYKDGEPRGRLKGENPAVFTDGHCYMDWIAEQYGKKPPRGWRKSSSCTNGGSGRKSEMNKEICRTNKNTICDFSQVDTRNKPWDACRLEAEEGFSYNAYTCLDSLGDLANCANDCKGVNANAIVAGGAAVGFAVAISGTTFGAPVGGMGLVAAGAMNGGCLPGQCMRRGRCCALVMRRGIPRCPGRC